MTAYTNASRRPRGFSLSELSVCVASIGIILAVGIPAAGRLGGMQRSALCLSRIGQMTNAFLTYSQDYEGVFPFTATMHEAQTNPIETWLCDWQAFPDPQAAINTVGRSCQEEWGAVGAALPQSGTLFTYTLHEELYRCPEFERIDSPDKAQNAFNYSRGLWCRHWRTDDERLAQGLSSTGWGDVEGPILKVADVFRPDDLPMILDEQWNRFIATAGNIASGAYNCNDYGFYTDNNIGVYHGPPVVSEVYEPDLPPLPASFPKYLWPQGGVGYYDGHAGLMRDPWPTLELPPYIRIGPGRMQNGVGAAWFCEFNAVSAWMLRLLHAQRAVWGGSLQPWGM
ncbi:MAG: hypothetical protein JXQ73_20930 [Phycisphaerae bacterium]|nr:hypothetical protein [Phycisphaerae bacterium]